MSPQSPSKTPVAGLEAAWTDLRAIVGEEHMRPATPHDALDGVRPQMVIQPASAEEIAKVLKTSTEAGLQVIPRGGGTKLDWGNPPRDAQLVLSTRRLSGVVEHAWGDMTATVEAGCTVQQLQQTLAEHGQRLALDPLWPEQATIGGILSTNESGPLRIRFGSLRDLIIGITLALPDGTIAKSGGKVVKNVAGYDLPKLATGALGTLGIITQAIFRLHPIPRASRTLSFSAPDSSAMNGFILAVLDSRLVPTGMQVRAENSPRSEVDLRFEGTTAGCDAQLEQVTRLASNLSASQAPAGAWDFRSTLWNGAEPSVIFKFTLLPTNLGAFLQRLRKVAEENHLSWKLVAQALGAGLIRLEGNNLSVLLSAVLDLRKTLENSAGSLVILGCPVEIKSKTDVWGSPGDALHLMKSIKAQFDPAGTLNPGRFIGGI
jgi:glycolate oxidase FAD binding subunit